MSVLLVSNFWIRITRRALSCTQVQCPCSAVTLSRPLKISQSTSNLNLSIVQLQGAMIGITLRCLLCALFDRAYYSSDCAKVKLTRSYYRLTYVCFAEKQVTHIPWISKLTQFVRNLPKLLQLPKLPKIQVCSFVVSMCSMPSSCYIVFTPIQCQTYCCEFQCLY